MAHFSADMVQYTNDLVDRRRAKGNNRDDFFARVLSEKATNLSSDFLRAQASTLVVAGSETTATLLAGRSICMKRKSHTDGIVQVSHITF
jgi:cytochrome P450